MKEMKDNRVQFRQIMLQKMAERNINQVELAKLIGTTSQAVSHYVSGKNYPSKVTRYKIAKALDMVTELEIMETGNTNFKEAFLYLKLAVGIMTSGNVQDGICSTLQIEKKEISDHKINLENPSDYAKLEEYLIYGKNIFCKYKSLPKEQKDTLNIFFNFEKIINENN